MYFIYLVLSIIILKFAISIHKLSIMKHFIFLNPATCRKHFNYECKRGRVPASNNLLWTLFLGMGENVLSQIKVALHGRTPIQALNDVASIYMVEHTEDYHVRKYNVCAISLGYFFEHIGLAQLNSLTLNLIYIISYDD